MVNQASSCDLKDLVAKFIPESIGKEIEKSTSSIFPLQNVFIRKVKILKAPKFDLGKLMEVIILIFGFSLICYCRPSSSNLNYALICCMKVHGDYTKEDVGVKVDRPAEDVPMEETEVVGA